MNATNQGGSYLILHCLHFETNRDSRCKGIGSSNTFDMTLSTTSITAVANSDGVVLVKVRETDHRSCR
ncbi:MAG: hypothetical protein H6830_04515 [Planctomycetes bacterium]|nr:hypothetical protein [Planctomycetota bacterium]